MSMIHILLFTIVSLVVSLLFYEFLRNKNDVARVKNRRKLKKEIKEIKNNIKKEVKIEKLSDGKKTLKELDSDIDKLLSDD